MKTHKATGGTIITPIKYTIHYCTGRKSTLRRARLAAEARGEHLMATITVILLLAALVALSHFASREYNAHMMCDVYGKQEWCGGAK